MDVDFLDEIEEDLLFLDSSYGEIDVDSEDFYSKFSRDPLLEDDEISHA